MVCPYCGHKNDANAEICSLCKHSLTRYKNRWIRWVILATLGVFLIVTLYAINYFGEQAEIKKENVQIEILSSAGYRTRSSDMVVEGRIRNVHKEKLSGVYVIVSWSDKNNTIMSEQKEKIALDPLLSYRTVAFIVKTPYKTGMEKYDIAFELKNGTVLLAQDLSAEYRKSFPPPEEK
ncbi:MAG: zinc ribbon domain-containing protein [Candidatus Schekmanbacteria bacterium]|nr:zinc ribbon domain-containing protein [Candidatus Schekmanbacteria bacterium]